MSESVRSVRPGRMLNRALRQEFDADKEIQVLREERDQLFRALALTLDALGGTVTLGQDALAAETTDLVLHTGVNLDGTITLRVDHGSRVLSCPRCRERRYDWDLACVRCGEHFG